MLPRRGQNVLLLAASYYFYACWDYRFLSLIVISTVIDYVCGLKIAASDRGSIRKLFLGISVVANLGMLGFFKYFDFFIDSLGRLSFHVLGQDISWRLGLILPVGISFYTFQTMSYTIDIYRGTLKPTRNIIEFSTFIAFFPQLVAGPIERASNLLPQFEKVRKIDWDKLRTGTWLILWGLFKKAAIADNLAIIADRAFNGDIGNLSGPEIFVAVYAFAFQIYCDFSGYSDMARGLARVMGFDLMLNFRNPYFATDPSEFWKRWHISLSTWLRDYLYIPLGGNRHGTVKMYRNLLLTMLLGGIWHGAAWTFVAWGVFHGLLLVGWRSLNVSTLFHRIIPHKKLCNWLLVIVMFHLICISWILFRANSLSLAGEMMLRLFTGWHISVSVLNALFPLLVLCTPLWLIQVVEEKRRNPEVIGALSFVPRTCLLTIIFAYLMVFGNTGGQSFIYFQF